MFDDKNNHDMNAWCHVSRKYLILLKHPRPSPTRPCSEVTQKTKPNSNKQMRSEELTKAWWELHLQIITKWHKVRNSDPDFFWHCLWSCLSLSWLVGGLIPNNFLRGGVKNFYRPKLMHLSTLFAPQIWKYYFNKGYSR